LAVASVLVVFTPTTAQKRGRGMVQFKSWRSYHRFEHHVKSQNRYIRDAETEEFLDAILVTGETRKTPLPKKRYLWRAQLGHDWEPVYQPDPDPSSNEREYITDIECPHPPERMKPCQGTASEGRANPKGIPYLYLSKSKDTAMSEVRPWVGSFISVGQFETLRDLVLVNCSSEPRKLMFYFEEPAPFEREQAVWSDINHAFSKPVNPSDLIADYVPTQIIAELFKNNGFDGLVYNSSLGEDLNVVVFDLDSVRLICCYLYEAKTVKFQFNQSGSPYSIRMPVGFVRRQEGSC
jgi:hypothetical protein